MRKHGWIVFLLLIVVLGMLCHTVLFKVGFDEIVIIETFGKAENAIYGHTDAGWRLKWPWPFQRMVRYDARIFIFEDTHEQIQTADKQNVLVTVFCGWRINDADLFIRRISTVAEAEVRIRSMVRDIKKQVVGKHRLEDFINTDPTRMLIPQIEENEILPSVQERAAKDYGIEVVTLGIKNLGLPKSVTKIVIENMQEERNRVAKSYEGLGQAAADAIRSRAEAARDQILEFARAEAKSIRAEGDRAAAEFYEKFKGHEQFAMFLRELDFLQETMKENSIFLLDPSVQHSIGFFSKGPSLPPLYDGKTTKPVTAKED